MGLFDMFTAEGRFKRHARRMSDRDAMPEDREASARFLANDGGRKAIRALLTRFDISLTQQMKDRGEKQFTYDLLLGLGPDVVEPLQTHLRRCKAYAWPLRLLVELGSEQAAVEIVFELLDGPVGKAAFEPERRKELLVWLAERRHSDAVDRVAPFLRDFDEDVRYAAAEVLIGQEGDAARAPLLAALVDPEEESNRLKHRLAQVFAQRGWPVGDDAVAEALPDGYAVRGGRIVAA